MSETNTITEVAKIFYELENTNSRLQKEVIIQREKYNDLFLQALKFANNPFVTTGLSNKKINKKTEEIKSPVTYDLITAMDYIEQNNSGKDYNIAWINKFIKQQDEISHEFLKQLFIKNVRTGVSATTINKIIPNLVPTYGIMKGVKYNIELLEKLYKGRKIIITKKLDGNRLTLIKKGESIKFYTRSGKEEEGYVELIESAKLLPDGVYDGEVEATGEFANHRERFQATNSITRKKGPKIGVKLHCFDYIKNIENFENGFDSTICINRKEKLEFILKNSNQDFIVNNPIIEITNSFDRIDYHFNNMINNGEEGVMVNIYDEPYERKVVKHLMKVKAEYTIDLRVCGLKEGLNDKKGMLGAFIVEYDPDNTGNPNTVNVGSGLTKELSKKIWENQEDYIGKIIEIEYMCPSENQNGEKSLNLPRFVRIREDKNEPSYN